jgi:hypothetical protein
VLGLELKAAIPWCLIFSIQYEHAVAVAEADLVEDERLDVAVDATLVHCTVRGLPPDITEEATHALVELAGPDTVALLLPCVCLEMSAIPLQQSRIELPLEV